MSDKKKTEDKKEQFSVFFRPVSKFTFVYDDILDDSHFKPTSETKRDRQATGKIGAGDKGLYDFDVGDDVNDKTMPSNVELALRSGKLDKADVQVLTDFYEKKAKSDVMAAEDKALLEAENKAAKNRTAAIDKKLGVDLDNVTL